LARKELGEIGERVETSMFVHNINFWILAHKKGKV
jgi:hypothetical protein